jgi:hypothetical protein
VRGDESSQLLFYSNFSGHDHINRCVIGFVTGYTGKAGSRSPHRLRLADVEPRTVDVLFVGCGHVCASIFVTNHETTIKNQSRPGKADAAQTQVECIVRTWFRPAAIVECLRSCQLPQILTRKARSKLDTHPW